MSEAVELYLRLKGTGRGKTFVQAANRNAGYLIKAAGDKPINSYTSIESGQFRDWLIGRDMTIVTVKRVFATVRAIINIAFSEYGVDSVNPFSRTFMPDSDDKEIRMPIPIELLRKIQVVCHEYDDDLRWIIALISDTGMRLSEVVGLSVSDIRFDEAVSYINLKPHKLRKLKIKSCIRMVPLVGESLWAAKRVVANSNGEFAFSRYTDGILCNANSASASLNKWMKSYVPAGCVIHSFRHNMRDRLRAVECPSDVIDAIGGWATAGVGQGYGSGYSIDVMYRWIEKVA